MADDQQKLEKTYSRESRLQRDGLEQEATPVALVRSVTQEHSRRMSNVHDASNQPDSTQDAAIRPNTLQETPAREYLPSMILISRRLPMWEKATRSKRFRHQNLDPSTQFRNMMWEPPNERLYGSRMEILKIQIIGVGY